MKLREIKERLRQAGVDSPAFDAAVLVEHFEGVPRASQAAHEYDYKSEALLCAVERRAAREPLQYIIGQWDFMGYTFKVSPGCLIPRPDTELLCRFLCDRLPRGGSFADLCTGSGCIAVAALLERQDARGTAVELYSEAFQTAAENAALHGVEDRLQLICADVCEGCLPGKYDVIVSNPPYISLEEMDSLSPEVRAEPAAALTDGGDGLSFIKKIIRLYPPYLNEGGVLAIEIGWRQGGDALATARQAGLRGRLLQDIEGRDRVLVIEL